MAYAEIFWWEAVICGAKRAKNAKLAATIIRSSNEAWPLALPLALVSFKRVCFAGCRAFKRFFTAFAGFVFLSAFLLLFSCFLFSFFWCLLPCLVEHVVYCLKGFLSGLVYFCGAGFAGV